MGQINSGESESELQNIKKNNYINLNSSESNEHYIKIYFYSNSGEPKFI